MTKVIALFNMSGGVGKSTLTMNLGYHLHKDIGKKILLIDMDPQASLTTFMGLSPFDLDITIYETLTSKEKLPIINNLHGCDLTPANIYLAQAELQLASELRREYKLSDAIKKLNGKYDLILIDCPPSLGLLSINCLVAANYLLIPIQTEYKSVEATINLLQTTYEIAQEVNPDLLVSGAVPTMYDDRTSQSKRALQTIREVFKELKQTPSFEHSQVFPEIPRRTDFANSTSEHQPLERYSKQNAAINILKDIATVLGSLK